MEILTSLNPLDVYKHFSLYKRINLELYDLVGRAQSSYPNDERLMHARQGSIKFPDAYTLSVILRKYKPQQILEIGSFLGLSTRWILEVTAGWNAVITAIDPNIRHRVFDDPRDTVEKLNSRFYPERLEIVTGFFGAKYGDIYYDYEHYEPKKDHEQVDELVKNRITIDRMWNRKFDFIFIDGDHSYQSVINNFETSICLLNSKGTINFHDALTWKDVNKALRDLSTEYGEKVKFSIHGRIDRMILKPFRINNDGVGFFRLLR